MATQSKIEWTETTWNPVTGCSKISAGCKFCYAERMAKRLKAMGNHRYKKGFKTTLHGDLIDLPRSWQKPRLVFVNSMSDLFHKDVPLKFIQKVFKTMNETPHTYQVLTKRSDRLLDLADQLEWTPNIWIGVSVEDRKVTHRIHDLQKIQAAHVRFLSIEPLIGPIGKLALKNIDWVIVGGESGPGARPMKRSWVESIMRQCHKRNVPFFFKQWGGVQKHNFGREIDGQTYDAMPEIRMDRQYCEYYVAA